MRIVTSEGMGALALAAMLTGSPGCARKEFEGPAAEVSETNIKLDLPAVPSFDMPAPYPDGSHPVAEMRLKGNKFMDTDVQVKGYIIWIYDCATAIRTPDMDDKEVARILKEEPERCNRPAFYLGDKPDDPTDRGLWVVEVPRPPREDEKKLLPREQLKAWPEVPVIAVGDQVTVTGNWTEKSPVGFKKSEGLLVYKSLVNHTKAAPSEGAQ
jgi:hypothetical protein